MGAQVVVFSLFFLVSPPLHRFGLEQHASQPRFSPQSYDASNQNVKPGGETEGRHFCNVDGQGARRKKEKPIDWNRGLDLPARCGLANTCSLWSGSCWPLSARLRPIAYQPCLGSHLRDPSTALKKGMGTKSYHGGCFFLFFFSSVSFFPHQASEEETQSGADAAP